MRELTDQQAKAAYLEAIEQVNADADPSWWAAVVAEVKQVAGAPTIKAAADVIAWWHNDWSAVNDTAIDAARRIRTSASKLRAASSRESPQRRGAGTRAYPNP